jgi:hypothetical protein
MGAENGVQSESAVAAGRNRQNPHIHQYIGTAIHAARHGHVLQESGLKPYYLEIEITESSLLENEEVTSSTINELKDMGVRIALDDFGTGYSSLSYLKRFKQKIDTLKIDRSFVRDVCEDQDDKEIIRTIIQLAHHLKMSVVAEGIENEDQLTILRSQKCDEIQGFLYSKPVPAAEFAELLRMGKIEPARAGKEQPDRIIENRRKSFRLNLHYPLSTDMTIVRLNGRAIQLGNVEVLVEDIGLGGLRFLSTIKLAVHSELILEFETEIMGHLIRLNGTVVWFKEPEDSIYQYGVQFILPEPEQALLVRLLNKLAIQLKKSPAITNGRFMRTDKISYLKNQIDSSGVE